jgi:hypothetical protein
MQGWAFLPIAPVAAEPAGSVLRAGRSADRAFQAKWKPVRRPETRQNKGWIVIALRRRAKTI